MPRSHLEIFLNGNSVRVEGASVFQTLSDFLRYERRLTGTKVVCAEGDCGACTVMVSKWRPRAKANTFESLNSCIAMMFLLDGAHIVSVEGLSKNFELCEVQNSMIRNFGGQCGFCTPGFVMAITGLYERKTKPTEKQVKNALTGNLCRCTGYTPILQAAMDVNCEKHQTVCQRYPQGVPAGALKEPILIRHDEKEFFAPRDLKSAAEYKLANPHVRIFSGSTDLGVQYNKGKIRPTHFMSLHLIDELHVCERRGEEFVVGAKATLSEFRDLVEKELPSVGEFMNIFASPQIKNAATLIGNIANGSPIADTTPFLMTLDAEVEVHGVREARRIDLKDFYLGYKKLALRPDEIITGIRFRAPHPQSLCRNYKVSQRRDLDISCVNASFLLQLENQEIVKARVTYGGVGPTTVRLPQVENYLQGKKAGPEIFGTTRKLISESIRPISDVRGSERFRRKVAENLFDKFIRENVRL